MADTTVLNTPVRRSAVFSGQAGTLPGVSLPPATIDLRSAVWGVDPSTRRMSLAVVRHGLEHVETLSLPKAPDNLRRYEWARKALTPWLRGLVSRFPPSDVFVEQPFAKGRNVHPSSHHMLGALLCALGGVLAVDVGVHLIDPSSWKCRAIGKGHGHASPDEYMDWARGAGYTGDLGDEAAAIGIATGGAVLLESSRSMRAA